MFFSCAPTASSGAPLLARGRARGARKHFTVDIHCHVETPQASALLADVFDATKEPLLTFANAETAAVNRKQQQTIYGKLTDVATRLKDMDKAGIDIQAISPAPGQYYYWAPPDLARQSSRLINERIAEIVAEHPDRFVGLGMVPLQAPELAVAELDHAVKKLGLRGVEINTNVAGEDLSAERFRPFFAKAQELDVLIFLHPRVRFGVVKARVWIERMQHLGDRAVGGDDPRGGVGDRDVGDLARVRPVEGGRVTAVKPADVEVVDDVRDQV